MQSTRALLQRLIATRVDVAGQALAMIQNSIKPWQTLSVRSTGCDSPVSGFSTEAEETRHLNDPGILPSSAD